jgi:hypothetical protein
MIDSLHMILKKKSTGFLKFLISNFVKRITRAKRIFLRKRILKKLKGLWVSGQGYFSLLKTIVSREPNMNSSIIHKDLSVLLIVPSDVNPRLNNYNGGAKDIQSMYEQIRSLGISCDVISVSRRTGHALRLLLSNQNRVLLYSSKQIILSIPGSSGGILLYLRLLGLPNLIFRSHNAELLHRLDWLKSSRSFGSFIMSLRKLILGSLSDLMVATFATDILSISQSEIRLYWSRLFPWTSRKLHYFPFMSPSHISAILSVGPQSDFENSLAMIVGGFKKGTLISRPDKQFIEHGSKVKDFVHANGFSLVSVGEGVSYKFCDTNYGHATEFDMLLRNTSLVIVPSSIGWGFKTKIADAVTLHQSIILPRKQYDRLGEWAKMVTPIDNWKEVSSLVLKKISPQEYEDFVETLRVQRETYLLDLAR